MHIMRISILVSTLTCIFSVRSEDPKGYVCFCPFCVRDASRSVTLFFSA